MMVTKQKVSIQHTYIKLASEKRKTLRRLVVKLHGNDTHLILQSGGILI